MKIAFFVKDGFNRSTVLNFKMRTHHLLFLALLLLASFAQAQTRKLAHRSHAGSPNTFAMLMDDDHGGGPVPEKVQEVYYLEPWIIKIRKHYEQVAKQNGPKVETKSGSQDNKEVKETTEPAKAPLDSLPQKPKSVPRAGKSATIGVAVPATQLEKTSALEIPRVRLAKATLNPTPSSGLNLWLLAGIIIACVAPCVLLLSGGLRSKN